MGRRKALTVGAVSLSGIGLLGTSGSVAAASSPTARLAGPIQVPVGEEVAFDASQSTADGNIVDYRWFAPDTGELGESDATVTHAFTETGDTGIQVTVEDDDGNTDLTALRVQVIEDGVVPGLDGPDAVEAGESVHVGIDWDQVDTDAVDQYQWTVTRESDGETIAETSGSDELGIDFTPEEQYTYYTVEGVFVDVNRTETIGTHLLQTAPQPTAELEGPSTVPIHEPVTFDASGSTAGDSSTEIVDYRWFAPGTGELEGSDATITHEFTETGDTGIQVTVEDERGHTDLETLRVEVTGSETFGLDGPDAVEAGESTYVGIDWDKVDPDAVTEFEWTVTRESDGETIAETSGSDELGIDFTPEEQHTTYTVVGTGIHEDGTESTATHVLETAPHPVARLDGPTTVPVNEPVTFDAGQSTHSDPDNEIVDYRWFEPGTGELEGSDATITHEFTETGDTGMQVTVEDADGNTDLETIRVQVIEDGVVPGLDGPDAVEAGESTYVGIDWDKADPDSVAEFEWTVIRESDGETIAETSGSDELGIDFTPEEQHTYYTVEGVFVDGNGTETVGTHVLRTAPHPVAELEVPDEATLGDPVTLDASGSSPPENGEIVDYRWFTQDTDDIDANTAELSHEFTETGYVGVQVTVEDEYGHTDLATARVYVSD